ncbi:MAG: histidine--tRNA ligase [Gammaproteobacteria bacterium]|nr:MAG: histidine--tRNA ligase [Gammaproteobacteria bacterium]
MDRTFQAVRGMNDILPEETPFWQTAEEAIRDLFSAYGYQEIRFPVVERTELFVRSIGAHTDIVEKEMYTFLDRNKESLALRPEGTAGCVRAVLQHGLLRRTPLLRLWYGGPMFRHERPQKGRYRQFHQMGVEAFGMEGPDIDAEQILLNHRLFRRLGLEGIRLEINSLGSPEARARYREKLVAYFEAHREALDEDSRRRLHTNPLRILDSKNPDMQDIIARAPKLLDELDAPSKAHFQELCGILEAARVPFTVNPRLVRGLDYYTKTVFEWITESLGAQGTVSAGGRYDGLVEQFGGPPTPAVGFAIGMERLVALLKESGFAPLHHLPHAYLVHMGLAREALILAETLRDALPRLRIVVHCGGGSLKSQLKKADRSGAQVALLLGEEELKSGKVVVKPLRQDRPQEALSREALLPYLAQLLEDRT